MVINMTNLCSKNMGFVCLGMIFVKEKNGRSIHARSVVSSFEVILRKKFLAHVIIYLVFEVHFFCILNSYSLDNGKCQ